MTSMKIALFSIAIACAFSLKIFSQETIQGTVKDANSNPIAYANIIAINLPDSTFHSGTPTDELGTYELRISDGFNGIIKASSLGYSEESAQYDAQRTEYNFSLAELTSALDEITINARLPQFEKKPDRLVVNVQNTVAAAGGTALEILEKSPGVGVDRINGGISLNAKAGVGIMINGKISNMPADAIVQMLSGMSAQNIKNIELITNPPAKYEAAGSALINIVLLENEFIGLNGNYGTTVNYHNDWGYGLNFNLNYRAGKWNSFITYTGNLDQRREEWLQRNEIEDDGSILINDGLIERDGAQNNHSVQLGTSYSINEKTSASLLLSAYRNRYSMSGVNNGRLEPEIDSIIIFQGNLREKNLWKRGIVSLGLDHRFNEKSEISAYLDYLKYDNDQPASFDNTFFNSESNSPFDEELIETFKNTPIDFWVAKVDFSNFSTENFKWDMGAKMSLSQFENEFRVLQTKAGETQILDDFSSISELTENVYAAYFSFNWKMSDKVDLTSGLRYEHTITQLGAPSSPLDVDRNYGNFFPNATFNYKIKEDKNLSFSYGKRIARPNFNDLAPFAFFQNPQTLVTGNPNLRPAITDNFEISYQPGKWFVSISYSNIKDQIVAFQPELDEETGLQLYRAQNLEYNRNYGAQLNMPIKFGNWLDYQNNFSLYYIEINPKGNGTNDVFTNLNFGYQGTLSMFLPKDFTLELTGNYQSNPSLWGVTDVSALYQLNFGLKKKIGENGGTISLMATDLFDTYKFEWQQPEDSITDFDFYGFYKPGFQGIRLSYTNTFGNRKLKEVKIDTGSEEEQNRITN